MATLELNADNFQLIDQAMGLDMDRVRAEIAGQEGTN